MTNDEIEQMLFTYLELGFSIIPIRRDSKKTIRPWKQYQHERADKAQIMEWLTDLNPQRWAVVTGEISNLMIVDCDNLDALQAAEDLGLTNGCCVKTPHGHHFYFRPPNDGKLRKNISGVGSNGTYWPQVNGLDLRTEGGYALLPPSDGYEWEIDEDCIADEMTVYQDWAGATFEEELELTPTTQLPPLPPTKFADLDLTDTSMEDLGKTKNITREKFIELAEQFPSGKIPRGGSGIHDATYKFLSEEILFVGLGSELEKAGRDFMESYFESPLTDGRFETSLATVRQKERANHPERFDTYGNYIHHLKSKGVATAIPHLATAQPDPTRKHKLLHTSDSKDFAEQDDIECWQYPWLPKNSIIQVYGYSGHGKSLFLQHALHHAACHLNFGCFERDKETPKILYLDFENGRTTWGRRVHQMHTSFGNPNDSLAYWAPWNGDEYINLREPEGVAKMVEMLTEEQPDILVIDTLRSAYTGLKENNAEEWSAINQLSLKIRNAGCTVILVHHSNKPDITGLGREAGSSNQLTTLETQVRVTQVLEDEELAQAKGAICANTLAVNPFYYMRKQMPRNSSLQMVLEISYGKVREWTDLHDSKQYIGFAERPDGTTFVCYSFSPKERLKILLRDKQQPKDMIIGKMGRSLKTLEKWADETGLKLPN